MARQELKIHVEALEITVWAIAFDLLKKYTTLLAVLTALIGGPVYAVAPLEHDASDWALGALGTSVALLAAIHWLSWMTDRKLTQVCDELGAVRHGRD